MQSVFEHPSVKDMIAKADKKEEKVFDVVVVCCALYGEEPGYYLAHRVSNDLEIYFQPCKNRKYLLLQFRLLSSIYLVN